MNVMNKKKRGNQYECDEWKKKRGNQSEWICQNKEMVSLWMGYINKIRRGTNINELTKKYILMIKVGQSLHINHLNILHG